MRFLLLGSALCASIFIPVAVAQDTKSKKFELAQEYSKLIPFDQEVDETINQISLQVPVAQRTQFRSILQRTIKVERLQTASEMALVDVFTVDELEALVAFNKTAEGKAIMAKMPSYQKRLQPVLESMVRDAAKSLGEQMGAN
jgi:hypothetical protein